MSAARLATIDRVVERGIKAGGYPGASVVVGRKGAAVWQRGFGRLGWTRARRRSPPTARIYDLASLTKVVGTTTALMILFDEGKLRPRRPGREVHPRVHGRRQGSGHHPPCCSSIAPASRPAATSGASRRSPEEARAAVIATPARRQPGRLLRVLRPRRRHARLRRRGGQPAQRLDQFLAARVFDAARHEGDALPPDASLRGRIAPTEVNPPRGYPLRGEVHDENAYALGGVAGHAGLFSTATDLAIFAQMMLNGHRHPYLPSRPASVDGGRPRSTPACGGVSSSR